MAAAAVSRVLVLSAAVFALQACEPGTGPFAAKPPAGTEAAAASPARATKGAGGDVEAPEVFQITDTALWDGRPSLGGVWVASPDTKDPERVIMRNPANGKFVVGALFKREVENPGPKLQISSDAADALGLLAGQPAKISVTALRRKEVAEAPTVAAAPAAGAIDAGGVETKPLDGGAATAKAKPSKKAAETAAVATAALDAAAAKPAAAKPAAPAPAASSGGRPIQIGFFSVETNAQRAADKLAKAGIAAEVRSESAKGKPYWSVVARGDAALLAKIKAAGFADAYLLK